MGPKKASESGQVEKKVRTTIEMKKKIIQKHENSISVSYLALQYDLAKSSMNINS